MTFTFMLLANAAYTAFSVHILSDLAFSGNQTHDFVDISAIDMYK